MSRLTFLPSASAPIPKFSKIDLVPVPTTASGLAAGPPQIGRNYLPPMNAMGPAMGPLQSTNQHQRIKAGLGIVHADQLPKDFSWSSPADVKKRAAALGKKSDGSQWIQKAPNQSQCGSCWAVSSTSALGDRWAIATDKPNPMLSAEVTCACAASKTSDGQGNRCCEGGFPYWAGQYFEQYGVPPNSCVDYADFCSPSASQCSSPDCPVFDTKCPDSGVAPVLYKAVKGSTVLLTDANLSDNKTILDNINRIKVDVYANGPATTVFWVFNDFIQSENGHWPRTNDVYIHNDDGQQPEGGHAVVIVGWGETAVPGIVDPVPYWVIRNSWGTAWGDAGHFKVAMSINGRNQAVGFDHTINQIGGTYAWQADTVSGAGAVADTGTTGTTNMSGAEISVLVVAAFLVITLVVIGIRNHRR